MAKVPVNGIIAEVDFGERNLTDRTNHEFPHVADFFLYNSSLGKSKMNSFMAALLLVSVAHFVQSPMFLGEHRTAQKPASDASQRAKFETGDMGELLDEDGVRLGFTVYKGSDGSRLLVLYETFESSTAAQKYFEKCVSKAAKLIQRKKTNASNKAVGERAEILLRLDGGKTVPAVLWTDGASFHEIYSESRKNVLGLEAVYQH